MNRKLLLLSFIAVGTPVLDLFDVTGVTKGSESFGITSITYIWRFIVIIISFLCTFSLLKPSHLFRTFRNNIRFSLLFFLFSALLLISINSSSSLGDFLLSGYRLSEWFIVILIASSEAINKPRCIFDFILTCFWLSIIVSLLLFLYNKDLILSSVPLLRFGGVGFHPNSLGLVFALSSLLFIFKNNYKNYLLGLVSIFLCLLTISRSSILSLFIGCLFYFIAEIFFSNKIKKSSAIGFILFSVLSYLLAFLPQVANFLQRGQNLESITSFSDRSHTWESSISLISQSPIFGHGFIIGPKKLAEYSLSHFSSTQAHNDFLNLAISGGFFCISIVIYLVISAYLNFKSYRFDHNLSSVLIALLSAVLTSSLFESALSSSASFRGISLFILLSTAYSHIFFYKNKTS